jgi:hypothetical protein
MDYPCYKEARISRDPSVSGLLSGDRLSCGFGGVGGGGEGGSGLQEPFLPGEQTAGMGRRTNEHIFSSKEVSPRYDSRTIQPRYAPYFLKKILPVPGLGARNPDHKPLDTLHATFSALCSGF